MPDRLRCPWLALCFLVAAVFCIGCKEQAPVASAAATVHDSGVSAGGTLQMLDPRLLQLGGAVDVENRYSMTVMVITRFAEERVSRCSGVLISPRHVLTAGHCICMPRQLTHSEVTGGMLIDRAACAETAIVKAVTYRPPSAGAEDEAASRVDVFRGSVHPHPELKLVLDAQGEVQSSHADLAMILLDEPLKEVLSFLPLADTEVRAGEPIIIVGHGYDEIADAHDGDRRVSRNRVTRAPTSEDERAAIEQPGGHPYKGDSGGPCLREGPKGPELVDISSRYLGHGATFTSLSP
jgi:hypothetical protein